MSISIKHAFQSGKGDGGDSTLVRPSNWNAEHSITLATNTVMGRSTAGTGAVEEIPCKATARSIMDADDVAEILEILGVSPPTTGDLRPTLKTSAPDGWVMFNDGTIGSATSGASYADADAEDLFELIYTNINDTNAPILTSAGGATTRAAQTNAATAWSANCRISLPKALGRALAVAGAGSGLTSRALAVAIGNEQKTLATANLPPYTPAGTNASSALSIAGTWGSYVTTIGVQGGGTFPSIQVFSGGAITGTAAAQTFTGTAQGGTSTPFDLSQPTFFANMMVKL